MDLPTVHIIAPFHARASRPAFDHCAFSSKAEKLPEVLKPFGYRCIEYGNYGSTSQADEHVVMLNREEFDLYYPAQKPTDFHGNYGTIGARGYPLFDQRLKAGLASRLKQGDIVAHVFGRAHSDLVHLFPQASHIETGIGYGDFPFGAHRIYESEEWRNYQMGRDEHNEHKHDKGLNRLYQFVVPNYFRVEDWDPGDGAGDYVLYFGRITADKGMPTIVEIIKAHHKMVVAGETKPLKFVFAGQGDFETEVGKPLGELSKYAQYLGPITGRQRSSLLGNARCMLAPTTFFEPQNGSGIESQLTGTPLLGVNYGAFTSTIVAGVTGWRCQTLGDWLEGIKHAPSLDRKRIREIAISKYSFSACGKLYDQAFRQISDLWREGWYTTKSYRVP